MTIKLDRDRVNPHQIAPLSSLSKSSEGLLPARRTRMTRMFEADGVAKRVSRELPQWNVVMMPPLHYGETGANEIGGVFIHPGTYGIRHTTLRSLVADMGGQIAQNGFKWIFVLTGHGSPTHGSRSTTPATSSVRPSASACCTCYRKLPANSGQTFDELQAIATKSGWQGYLSAPAKANAAYGRDIETWWVDGLSDLILRATGGENLLKAPRMPAPLDPGRAGVFAKALDNERAFEATLDARLAARRQR